VRAWLQAGALACATVSVCSAASTQTWEMNGYPDFSRGRFSGLSITYDGKLSLGPALTTVFDSGQAEVWSVATAPDGSIYLGTGNRGRLFRVDTAGPNTPSQGTLVWTADQPEIFAVTVDAKGVVYAGSSPDGKVYRIENGKAVEYFAPGAHYIWALAVAPDGALMVATGDEGKIFRVTTPVPGGPAQGSVYYETGQAHVTALAFDAQGRLLAGSEPNGILYRVPQINAAPGKAFVLYKSSLPEIRAIVPAADGGIYVAAMGGGIAKRVGAASSAITSPVGAGAPSVSTTITVTEQSGINPPPKPEAPKPPAPAPQTTVVAAASSADSSSGDRSALYKISADNSVETLWTSKDENIYDVAVQDLAKEAVPNTGPSVMFLTDAQARIYQLEGPLRATLVAQANEGDATRLLASNRGLLVATGNLGKLLLLGNSPARGWFESPVHDSGSVAKWGRISWHGGDSPGIALRTRSGNSARPDATWSDWSEPVAASISSPNARYIQWRAEFANAGSAPSIDDVIVAYLPQNSPPVVKSLVVIGAAKPAGAFSTDAASPVGTIGHGGGQQIQVVWQADDPDSDRLVYSLYFRGEDESQWKLLRANLTETLYSMDGDALADGRYFFRVVASDRPSNPVDLAREAELVSTPVVIDNTPPVVTLSGPGRTGTSFEIYADAIDRGSLRRCEYSIDAGPWMLVEASDGVTDSPQERFTIAVANLPAGEHVISVRVYDAAGNAGLAKYVAR
jgi:hypothetical protein